MIINRKIIIEQTSLKPLWNIYFISGDLLNNYPWEDDLMNVSRLLFSITILLTYPIECFVCREVILNLLYGNDPGN